MTVELQAEQIAPQVPGAQIRHGHQRQRARSDRVNFKDPNDQKATRAH